MSAHPKVEANKLQMIECITEWWWYTEVYMPESAFFTVIFAMTSIRPAQNEHCQQNQSKHNQ